MTPEGASRAIFARWITMWPTASSGVAYATDNNVAGEPQGSPFARVSIISGDSSQRTLGGAGNRRFTNEGVIEVRLSGPVNAGRGTLDALALKVRDIFQSTRFGEDAPAEEGIETQATSIGELRRDRQAPNRWLIVCETPFEYTEVR